MAKTKIKKQPKKKLPVVVEKPPELPPATRFSDDPLPKQDKWVNRQRVLVFSSRGINHRHRHLMEDIKRLMPHHKPESKMERNKNLFVVNEMCEMKNCNKAMMFEGRKKKDLYVWCSNVPNGPSVKFLVENLYTMGELKFTGNCLTGSRPLLSFDKSFSDAPHLQLFKELLTQTFGVPKHHPKSQPFIDHVYSFTYLDNRIWFRNYQILTEDGALAEVGPRFVLNPVKIFSGSFGGATLWENPDYISPSKYRQSLTKKAAHRYENKIQQKAEYEASRPETAYPEIDDFDIFKGDDPMEKAKEEIENDIKKEKAAEEEKQKAEHIKTIKIKRKKPKTVKKPVPSKPKKGNQGENKSKKSKSDDNQPKKEFSIKRKQFKAKNKVGKKGEAKKGKRPKFRKS